MSVVFIVIPAIGGGWSVLAPAIAAATAALGYRALRHAEELQALEQAGTHGHATTRASIELELPNAELVQEALERDDSFTVVRGDVKITFSRDARGRCRVHVEGANKSHDELRAIGKEVMNRVIQHYAYNKVMSELEKRGFNVVREEVDQHNVIRIRVRKVV